MNKKTRVSTSNVRVGLRVTRGPYWEYGNQDFFPGNVGIITSIDTRNNRVQVEWKNKDGLSNSNVYRIGDDTPDLYAHSDGTYTEYPEPYDIPANARIIMIDTQGHCNLEAGKEYKVIEVSTDGKSITLQDGDMEHLYTCEGNSVNKYFMWIAPPDGTAPIRKEEVSEKPPQSTTTQGYYPTPNPGRTGTDYQDSLYKTQEKRYMERLLMKSPRTQGFLRKK